MRGAMVKNILIFADGTGNEGGLLPDESRTNVYKLFRATRVDPDSWIEPSEQLAFYVPGIGTPSPGPTSRWRRLRETIQQMFGGGLTRKIVDCYLAVIGVWQPGDRIYVFGFSRGAYTVRCLAHVLELVGIPTTETSGKPLILDPVALRKTARAAVGILYKWGLPVTDRDKRNKQAANFKKDHRCLVGPEKGALPYFIGVWDTVAAIGWTKLFPKKYDMHFPKEVPFARHAAAIDEYRKSFRRVEWGGSGTVSTPKPGELAQFVQIWFSGNHADIGGSYPENESRLSDFSLKWMADFIEFELPKEAQVKVNRDRLHCFPSSAGMMHDECKVGIGGTRLHWHPKDRDIPIEAVLHDSVYERLRLESVRTFTGYEKYRPVPLLNHTLAKQAITEAESHKSRDDGAPHVDSVSR
jgi:uncharacterized protein (DUF2235 family)